MSDFISAMEASGLIPKDVIADGRIRRCRVQGKYKDPSGWYVLYSDTLGIFGDWRTGSQQIWTDKTIHLDETELYNAKKKMAQIRIELLKIQTDEHEEAEEKALEIWNKAESCGEHPYLKKKIIIPYGIKQYKDYLVIPIRDESGTLCSLQFINSDGIKRFLKHGRIKARFFHIEGDYEHIALCEGYATGCSIFEHTGYTVVVAFFASNLERVGAVVRAMFPTTYVSVWGDNDQWGERNTGAIAAHWTTVTALLDETRIPDFSGLDVTNKPTDWNDYFNLVKTD